jgi:protoporphyrinogen oxidase
VKVGIIGAGVCGLALARLLAARGVPSEVFEAAPQAGGLLAGLRLGEARVDAFYHHLFSADRHALALCTELRVPVTWHTAQSGHEIAGRIHPLGAPRDWLALPGVPKTAALGLARLAFDARWRSASPAFDAVSALAYLERTQSPALLAQVFRPLLERRFGPDHAAVSAFWLLDRFGSRLRGSFGRAERLGYPAGGFVALADALTAALPNTATLHLGAKVESVASSPTGVTLTAGGRAHEFTAAISTIPLPALRGLLPPEPAAALPDVPWQSCSCQVLAVDRPLSPYYWLGVSDPGPGLVGVVEHTRLVPPNAGAPHLVYLARYHRPEAPGDDLTASTDRALATWFPDFAGHIVGRAEASAAFAQPLFTTGWCSRRPARVRPLPRLWATDASLDTPYQTRSVDGAVRRATEACAWVLERR